MNKTKIIIVSVAGVSLVASLALGYLAYDESGRAEESRTSADRKLSQAQGWLRKGADAGSVKTINEVAESYSTWADAARTAASVGDLESEPTTASALKGKMVEDARRFSSLPGIVDGKLVKNDFGFGFAELVTGGAMPAAADLDRLQREWHDVVTVLDLLVDAGAVSIDEVKVEVAAKPRETEVKPKRGRKKSRKTEEKVETELITAMTVQFQTPASGLVASLNSLAANPRFIVVEDMTFARASDEIVENLAAMAKHGEEASEGESASRNRRPRGRSRSRKERVEEETDSEKDAASKPAIVTDPQTAPAFKVSLKLKVYDFRTGEQRRAEREAAAAAEKEEAK